MAHLAFGEKKTLDDVWPVKNKRFFVRTDFESLMEHGMNQPPSPLLTTITRLICQGGKVIVACSFGRYLNAPPICLTDADRELAKQRFPRHLSSSPLFTLLRRLLPEGTNVEFVDDPMVAAEPIAQMEPSSVVVLENLRMYRNELSEDADERAAMAQVLASYTDVFISDTFATSHLVSAGAVELPKIIRHGACGALMEQEMLYFSKMLVNPPRPVTLVLGSVHIEDKLDLLDSLIRKVDKVLLGTAVAIPFLEAQGIPVGRYSPFLTEDLVDDVQSAFAPLPGGAGFGGLGGGLAGTQATSLLDGQAVRRQHDHATPSLTSPAPEVSASIRWSSKKVTLQQCVRRLMQAAEKFNVRLITPMDFIAHESTESTRFPTVTTGPRVPDGLMALDIGPQTVQYYSAELKDSRTVFWTGRMGCAAPDTYTAGTAAIARAIGNSNSISVVGGRRTVAFCRAAGVEENISHLSTGPYSMLRVLEGSLLPALSALSDAHPSIAADIRVSVQQLFRHCTLFRHLSPQQLRAVVCKAVPRSHTGGDVVMHEGDKFSSMFVVARGYLVAAPRTQLGKSTAGRLVRQSETVGEWEFMTQRVSQEVVVAGTDDTITYQLSAGALEEAFGEVPSLAPALLCGASEPLRMAQAEERRKQASEWTAVARDTSCQRKPGPFAGLPAGSHAALRAVMAAFIAAALYPLTLRMAPFAKQRMTCIIAAPGDGVVMRVVHAVAREVAFSALIPTRLGAAGAAALSAAIASPLRIAAVGVPFAKIGAAAALNEALGAAAMSAVPRAVHALYLFSRSAFELYRYRRTAGLVGPPAAPAGSPTTGAKLSWSVALLLAMLCRAAGCVAAFPIVALRPSAGGAVIGPDAAAADTSGGAMAACSAVVRAGRWRTVLLAYVVKQVASLVIDALLSRVGRHFFPPRGISPATPVRR